MKNNYKNIISLFILTTFLSASGAFDHGSSTGKRQLELDFTLNPFNYFRYGQSYIVYGYGITSKLDIHGYFCDHSNYNNGVKSYYYGIFYQFFDSKYLDLATAIGKRKMMDLNYEHIFFPQIFYNLKFLNNYTIGGSFVRIQKETDNIINSFDNDWLTFDISLFIPLKYFSKYKKIDYVKLGVGIFQTGIMDNNNDSLILPTYSLDVRFKPIQLRR